MDDMWRPGPVLVKEGRMLARRVSSAIASARPPRGGGKPGGSLGRRARKRSLVVEHSWGAVVRFWDLGSPLSFFRRGTPTQAPRPLQLVPDLVRIRGVVARDAAKHFRALETRDAKAQATR